MKFHEHQQRRIEQKSKQGEGVATGISEDGYERVARGERAIEVECIYFHGANRNK